MDYIHSYSFPTAIDAGPGVRKRLPDVLKSLGVANALVVTDRDLVKLDPVKNVCAVLSAVNIEAPVFSGIFGNPVVSQVQAGVEMLRKGKHDGIVAIGGGASLDVAKCIALMANHPGVLVDYEDGKPGGLSVDQPIPAIVAIPTTAGTGSEVGRAAVISEDASKVKRIIFSPRLLPSHILLDAELTLALPAKITAATGMDAVTHLVEAYIAKGRHPLCDGIALEGLRLCQRHLVNAVEFAKQKTGATGEHLAARDGMLHAALMGAVAFQKGLGANHSMAHALSTVCDLHHGLANAIVLPHVMAFNLAAVPDRFATMAQVVGAKDFEQWLIELLASVSLPATLGEVGVTSSHVERLVEVALADGCHALNPRPISGDDFHALFVEALG